MANREALRFKTNIPEQVIFQYDKYGKTGKNKFDKNWFSFGVTQDGVDKTLFATDYLHDFLHYVGLKKGDVYTITQMQGEGNTKYWTISLDGIEYDSRDMSPDNKPKTSSKSATPKQIPVPEEKPTLDDLVDTLVTCFNKVEVLSNKRNMDLEPEIIEKLAVSIFITASRNNLFVKNGDARSMGNIPIAQGEQPPANIPIEDDVPF